MIKNSDLKCWHCNERIGGLPYGVGANGSLHWACYDKLWPNRLPLVPAAELEALRDIVEAWGEPENYDLPPKRIAIIREKLDALNLIQVGAASPPVAGTQKGVK